MAFVFISFLKGLFMKSIKMALLAGACLSLLGTGFAGQVRAEEGGGGRDPSVIMKEIEQKKEELKSLHQELKSVRGERRDDRMEKMKEKHQNMSEEDMKEKMKGRMERREDRRERRGPPPDGVKPKGDNPEGEGGGE